MNRSPILSPLLTLLLACHVGLPKSLFLLLLNLPAAAFGAELAPLAVRAHERQVVAIAVSADGARVVTAGDDAIKVWDAESGKAVLSIPVKPTVTAVTFSSDSKQIASGSWEGELQTWDAAGGQTLLVWSAHVENITGIAFSGDGRYLVTSSGDDTWKVWNARSGKNLLTVEQGNEYDVACVAFSPDGKQIATGDGEGNVRLWDAATGEELQACAGHGETIAGVTFAGGGKWLVSASADDTIKVWDATSGTELHTLSGHTDDITSLASSADGKWLVSGSADQTVRVWDAASGKERWVLQDGNAVSSVSLSANGKTVAFGAGGWLKIAEVR